MPRFNLGLFQKNFLSTSKVTGPAINMGCTRGRGSTTRMFNYCNQRSSNPSLCINDFIIIQKPTSSEIPPIYPSAPTITSFGFLSSTAINIVFTAPSSDGGSPITNYKYSTDNGSTFTLVNPAKITSPITVTGLTPNTNYQVVIRAVNANGDGTPSTAVGVTTTLAIWSALSTGLGADGRALAIDSNNNVYVGGSFNSAGGASNTNRIAKFNSSTWSSVGNGVTSGTLINSLAFDSNNINLYAGGNFTNISSVAALNIAKWNGSTWSALGVGLRSGSSCNAISIDSNNNVYAGGTFTTLGDNTTVNGIAKWNGTSWSQLNYGSLTGLGTGGVCNALAVDSNNNVYVGGNFNQVSGPPFANYIAKWDPSQPMNPWNNLNNGLNGICYAIAIDSVGNVYVTGGFTKTIDNSITLNRIAKWDGSTWSPLVDDSTGVNGLNNNNGIGLVIDSNDNVYVSGSFTQAGGITCNGVAKWNPVTLTWSALTDSSSGTPGLGPAGLIAHDINIDSFGNIYVCGTFTLAGGNSASKIAKYG